MARYATNYGAYEIDSIPGQPQAAHCHSFFVRPEARGKGYGHALKRHQNRTLQSMGYDFATCTVAASNSSQLRVLQSAGWVPLHRFQNTKTGEETVVYGVEVRNAVTE